LNVEEYEVMHAMEKNHWWYQGLRDYLNTFIRLYPVEANAKVKILDAGCGTGGNLAFLSSISSSYSLEGFDLSDKAVEYSSTKAPSAEIYSGNICAPMLKGESYDIAYSMDVVCIPGWTNAKDGLKQICSALKPGGVLIINLPAYQWMYSEHDVAVHVSERFTKANVEEMVVELGLQMQSCSYRVFFLFPLVFLLRLPTILFKKKMEKAKSDLSLPSPLLNRLLSSTLKLENRLIKMGLTLPFGSSISFVASKPR